MQVPNALNAYMADHPGTAQQESNPWGGLTGWAPHVQNAGPQGVGRALPAQSPSTGPNPYDRSHDGYTQNYNTLVRPSAQYRPTEESRAPYGDHGAPSAAAWQRDNRAPSSANGMWKASDSHPSAYTSGSEAGLSAWQQQLAQLQHSSMSQAQHQGWTSSGNAAYHQPQQLQQQQRLQQQNQPQQLARKLSSGDQLVQDLRLTQWASMASPPHQQHGGHAQLPQAMPAPSSGSGFENMWGTAAPLETAPAAQPVANFNNRFPEDAATLLDFPDWDGPGLAAALPLDDMIMNSIGQSGPPLNAPADSTLHQGSDAGTQRPTSDSQAAHKGASKKKHKPGKKAAKAAAVSGSQSEEPAVEFLVATEAYQEQDGILMQGIRTPPVTVLTEEPVNTLLPASAYMTMEQRLPLQDPQLKVLKWTFLQHLPDSWVA